MSGRQKSSRLYVSLSGNVGQSGGFSDSARQAANRARSAKKTQELLRTFLSYEGTGEECFRVAGLNIEGLRWSILSVDTERETVMVETTDRSAPFRQYGPLPLRAVIFAPLRFLTPEEAAEMGISAQRAPSSGSSGATDEQLEAGLQSGEQAFRLAKENKRGYRFKIVALDLKESSATIQNGGDIRTVFVGNLDYSPVTLRNGRVAAVNANPARSTKDNEHLLRHAAGVPWGDED